LPGGLPNSGRAIWRFSGVLLRIAGAALPDADTRRLFRRVCPEVTAAHLPCVPPDVFVNVRSALHERTIALWLAASRGYLWYFRPSPRVSSSLPPPPPPDRGNNRRAFPFWRSRGPRKTQSLSRSTREPLRTRDLPPAPGILPTPT